VSEKEIDEQVDAMVDAVYAIDPDPEIAAFGQESLRYLERRWPGEDWPNAISKILVGHMVAEAELGWAQLQPGGTQ